MSKITAISSDEVHKITSGQVIIDLITAVKELIDNSIDANSRHIELTFKNYGIESIECSDDGDGIEPHNYESLALKHHTSKIGTFEDVSSVQTLGFRGEALASMCAIATVAVTTTVNPPRADKLEYDFNGRLKSKSTTTRNKGSSFQITQLFNNLPVRRKEFIKNCKREFTKCIALIQNYALIQKDITFSVWHITVNGRKSRMLSTGRGQEMSKKILSIYGTSSMRGLSPIKLFLDLNPFKKLMRRKHIETATFEDLDYKIVIEGYVSKCSFGCGRNSKDRQSVFVNRRPVEYPILIQTCNEVYRSFNNVQYPTIFLNFQLSPKLVDINVTPDKRTVLLHNEKYVVDVFRENLIEYYDNQELELPKSDLSQSDQRVNKRRRFDFGDTDILKNIEQSDYDNDKDYIGKDNKEAQSLNNSIHNESTPTKDHVDFDVDDKKNKIGRTTKSGNLISQELISHFEINSDDKEDSFNSSLSIQNKSSTKEATEKKELFVNEDIDDCSQTSRRANSINEEKNTRRKTLDHYVHLSSPMKPQPKIITEHQCQPVRLEIEGKKEEIQATLSQNEYLSFLPSESENGSCCGKNMLPREKKRDTEFHESQPKKTCKTASSEEEEEDESYARLEPIEVNIRIPTSLDKNVDLEEYRSLNGNNIRTHNNFNYITTSLFIKEPIRCIDNIERILKNKICSQHNQSIQKNSNFEDSKESEKYLTLSVKKNDFLKMHVVGQFNLGFIIVTRQIDDKYDMFIVDQHASDEKYNFEVLQKITVFKSQRLIAPLSVELSVIDEMLVLDNLSIFEKNGFKMKIDENESPGSRIKLYSLPVSKRTLFDIDDFYELIHLIKESGGLNVESVRPSKIRSMFAMRACRNSVMIGKPLAKKTMTRIVRNLSGLDKPWNCPHGRPTMRHLMELQEWDAFADDYEM